MCRFLPCSNMNQPYMYVCPLPREPPSHRHPHPTLLDCHGAPALNSLRHTANSHWLSVLHMYVCFSAALNSPTLFFPSVCSLCLPLHCCPASRFSSTIFLDSIYMQCCAVLSHSVMSDSLQPHELWPIYALIYDICFSLSDSLHFA